MKMLMQKERIIKGAILLFFGMALYMGISCSPVKFNSTGTPCDVANPCVTGQGALEVDQTFTFQTTNKVDILVVDDNSGSMTTEQENLGNSLNGFIGNLMNAHNSQGLDYQVAVTNTDVCGTATGQPAGFCPGPSNIPGAGGQFMGPLNTSPMYGNQYIITPLTSSADQMFYDTVQRQNQIGSGDERAIYAVNLAIDHKDDLDAGFFRDNSNLAVVILSDEDERSVGGLITTDPGYAPLENYDMPDTLISKVASTWNNAKTLMVNSIIIIPNDTTLYPDPNNGGQMETCLQVQSNQGPYYTAHPGVTYQNLSQKTGGAVGSICDNGAGAFAQMLNNITGAITQIPQSKVITLAHIPNVTPTVTFTPQGNAVTWTWAGNQITFSSRPVDGTSVDVTYTYNSGN